MHGNPTHGTDIAHVGGNGFVADRIRWMKTSDEVCVFGDQIRTENCRVPGGKIEDRGIIANSDGNLAAAKSLADFAYEGTFAEIAEVHTVASAFLRRRRGPRTTFFASVLQQGRFKYTLDVIYEDELHFLSDRLVDVLEIALVQ